MKVCLIGNNLTSLLLAVILSKKKFQVEIISIKRSRLKFKTRSLGISEHNLNFLCNYFKDIKKITNPINEIKVSIENKKNKDEILFNNNSNVLFNMIKYDKLIAYLENKSKKNNYIKYKFFKTEKSLLSLKNSKKYDLFINCEATNILTKKFLKRGINKNYNNKAFTTIITHKKNIKNRATQIFTNYGPVAFLPLCENTTSVVFSFEVNKDKNISNKKILDLINYYNPSYKITNHKIFENFNLKLKLPKKYFHENILFFGDAIHTIHPLAGQGFNMTIRDIEKLTEILEKKILLGLPIDKYVYEEFEKKSKSKNSTFSFGIDLIYELFRFKKNFIPDNVSKKFFTYINRNTDLKNFGINFANKGL